MKKGLSVLEYHERSKHSFYSYARSAGYLDWETQPNPFRHYAGAPKINLPLMDDHPGGDYRSLYESSVEPYQFNMDSIGAFFQYSLGISAWKAVPGSTWSLRVNPSSGDLHPTEAHIVTPSYDGISAGVYHYNSFAHSLEQRIPYNDVVGNLIKSFYDSDGFLVGLSSIFWRESWKYGERAFRYCNHDVGHALACLRFAANLFGWNIVCLNDATDADIEKLLGFHNTGWHHLEEEEVDLVCFVYPRTSFVDKAYLPQLLISIGEETEPAGKPEQLSPSLTDWQVVYNVAELTRKTVVNSAYTGMKNDTLNWLTESSLSAGQIIMQRRSAQQFERGTTMPFNTFISMLDKTIPRRNAAPFDVVLGSTHIHLILFVHGVEDIPQGMYLFVRDELDEAALRESLHEDFQWKRVCDGHNLYQLESGECRNLAVKLSCTQSIAGDSVFSLGMIARFNDVIEKDSWNYKRLFWESGMIGQVLYLEAEAHDYRGTGIGCFFDNPVHELLGITDNSWQSLYHFTVGMPVDDSRIQTLPPYYHLEEMRK